jgi:hypothetical protein
MMKPTCAYVIAIEHAGKEWIDRPCLFAAVRAYACRRFLGASGLRKPFACLSLHLWPMVNVCALESPAAVSDATLASRLFITVFQFRNRRLPLIDWFDY